MGYRGKSQVIPPKSLNVPHCTARPGSEGPVPLCQSSLGPGWLPPGLHSSCGECPYKTLQGPKSRDCKGGGDNSYSEHFLPRVMPLGRWQELLFLLRSPTKPQEIFKLLFSAATVWLAGETGWAQEARYNLFLKSCEFSPSGYITKTRDSNLRRRKQAFLYQTKDRMWGLPRCQWTCGVYLRCQRTS